jgi:hypothetical protein
VRAHATFNRFHLGGDGAARGAPTRCVTPTGRRLELDATLDRVQGRKRFVSGRLRDGTTAVADAEGLFVELLPGQP